GAESEWFARLKNDQSTEAMADDEPVLYIDGNWNVYPNFSTPEPIWRLGNLKTDGAEAILEAYLQNKSIGQQIRLNVPLGEIVSAVGDPTSKRLFGKGDYVEYCLNLYARKVLTAKL
ncbi:MAG: radical SAM protein, partial [Clostridia bacterium]|nr:radical SAM protein [Clostridia bacterium]